MLHNLQECRILGKVILMRTLNHLCAQPFIINNILTPSKMTRMSSTTLKQKSWFICQKFRCYPISRDSLKPKFSGGWRQTMLTRHHNGKGMSNRRKRSITILDANLGSGIKLSKNFRMSNN